MKESLAPSIQKDLKQQHVGTKLRGNSDKTQKHRKLNITYRLRTKYVKRKERR